MGTTLTAINGDSGVVLRTVVAIEGIEYLITDGSTSTEITAAATAWVGTGWASVVGGLSVAYNIDQSLSPWEPFNAAPSRVTLTVMDADGNDTLGGLVFKREASIKTTLAEDVDPTETAITVKRADELNNTSNYAFIGCETVEYGTVDIATDVLSGCTRGAFSPFKIAAGTGFGRTHYNTPTMPGVDTESTPSTQVTENPIEWRGRWVGVWIHRVVDGVLDTKAQAHCVFAGKIVEVEDSADGKTVIHCAGVLDTIKETVILRQQWRARLREGVWVKEGTRIKAWDERNGSRLKADDLVVTAVGAATPPYEIEEGFYYGGGAGSLESKINDWLAQAKADTDLNFRLVFTYIDRDEDGAYRSSLKMADPVGGSTPRHWRVSTQNFFVRSLFGWESDGGIGGSIGGSSSDSRFTAFSAREPLRLIPMANEAGDEKTFYIDEVMGSFVTQTDLLPQVAAGYAGVITVGNLTLACNAPSVTNRTGTVVVGPSMSEYIGGEAVTNIQQSIDRMAVGVSQSGPIEITQILVLEASFGILTLSMLASTGGANWPAYELLPEHCSAAIPYDLISNLDADIGNAPFASDRMRLVITKPTRLVDLWNVSFILRHVQFVWRQGAIRLKGFATPNSAATLTIGTDDRAAAIGMRDSQRAVTKQSDEWMRNVITIKSGAGPTGEDYTETTTIEIPGSVSNHGGRILTLSARNAVKGAGDAAEDVRALMPTFIGPLPFLAYPATLITVPIHFNLFEQATPGEVCLFSDDFARDPSTGTRGIASKPALVVGQRIYGWGGESGAPVGEITLMLFPRLSLAPYSPCAQVDETQANAGYDAGTKVLTCYAHAHSEASAAADATLFPATSEVTVIEIDPAAAGAPTSWTDTVASQVGNTITLTAGLAGWDNTKRYRVYARTYPNATTAQQAKAFQADDADGMVADTRAPYGLSFSAVGQTQNATDSAATELAERPPTAAYGDGVALDTGHARAIARGLNNAINYLTAMQTPEYVTEMSYGGSGTRRLVYCAPVFFGAGTVSNQMTRKLYVAPWFRSATGGSITCRVTLSPRLPRSADPNNFSRDDVVRQLPYVEQSFSTTSTTYAIPTATALDISHCNLNDSAIGGWAWLYAELTAHGRMCGFGALYEGPQEAP